MVTEVTDANFEEIVLNSNLTEIVDLWAEWCGPCRMIHPIIDELANEYEGKAIMAKLDVDSNQETAKKYKVMNIPTLLFFKNGEVADKQVGAVPKKIIAKKLDALI